MGFPAAGSLLCLVVLAAVLRLVPIVFVPSLNWGDEIFQIVEPAHRLVYGYGLVPWEFQLGMRSWLLPGVVAGLMEIARLIGDGPGYYLPVIAIAFGLLSSAPLICCFLWCARWFGLAGAVVAAFAVAVAPELVYFGARTLSEVAAAHLLIIAVYLIEPGYRVTSRRRLAAAGMLLGIVCLLRIQIAPAVAVIALWPVPSAWRCRLPALVAGGVAALAFGAVADWLTLGYPLASVWRNLYYNVYLGMDAPPNPWYYYLAAELAIWLVATPFVALLAALGGRRLPVLMAAAIVVIAVHSAVPHREYRYVYPAVPMLMTLAAIGLGDLVRWGEQQLVKRRCRRGIARAAAAILVATGWGVASFSVWSDGAIAALRQRDHDELLAMTFVRRLPAQCGVGLYGKDGWVWYGGYTYLHRPIPMFWPRDAAALSAAAGAFDTLIYPAPLPIPPGFATLRCFGKICVAHRPGVCEAYPMPTMPFPRQLRALAPAPKKFEALPVGERPSGAEHAQP